jgi:hypothetical protein
MGEFNMWRDVFLLFIHRSNSEIQTERFLSVGFRCCKFSVQRGLSGEQRPVLKFKQRFGGQSLLDRSLVFRSADQFNQIHILPALYMTVKSAQPLHILPEDGN